MGCERSNLSIEKLQAMDIDIQGKRASSTKISCILS